MQLRPVKITQAHEETCLSATLYYVSNVFMDFHIERRLFIYTVQNSIVKPIALIQPHSRCKVHGRQHKSTDSHSDELLLRRYIPPCSARKKPSAETHQYKQQTEIDTATAGRASGTATPTGQLFIRQGDGLTIFREPQVIDESNYRATIGSSGPDPDSPVGELEYLSRDIVDEFLISKAKDQCGSFPVQLHGG